MGEDVNKFYKIEKDVKEPLTGRWGKIMHGMEVGDSILFPTHDEARSFCGALRAKHMKGKQRAMPEGGHRVWRYK